MSKKHEIRRRNFDGKYVVWSEIYDPKADLDYYRKNGLPVPTVWVPGAVELDMESAKLASQRSRI